MKNHSKLPIPYISNLGGPSAVARICGIGNPSAVSQWTAKGKIPQSREIFLHLLVYLKKNYPEIYSVAINEIHRVHLGSETSDHGPSEQKTQQGVHQPAPTDEHPDLTKKEAP